MPELNHDRLYEIAFNELRLKKVDKALWARSFAESDGDYEKARARYIHARVIRLSEKIRSQDESVTQNAARRALEEQTTTIADAPSASCTKCGSNQWKLASVVHAEGTYTGGVNTDFGSASMTNQTEISRLAAPPNPYAAINLFIGHALTASLIGILVTWFVRP